MLQAVFAISEFNALHSFSIALPAHRCIKRRYQMFAFNIFPPTDLEMMQILLIKDVYFYAIYVLCFSISAAEF